MTLPDKSRAGTGQPSWCEIFNKFGLEQNRGPRTKYRITARTLLGYHGDPVRVANIKRGIHDCQHAPRPDDAPCLIQRAPQIVRVVKGGIKNRNVKTFFGKRDLLESPDNAGKDA